MPGWTGLYDPLERPVDVDDAAVAGDVTVGGALRVRSGEPWADVQQFLNGGSDYGAAITAAAASLPNGKGRLIVPAGTLNLTTDPVLPVADGDGGLSIDCKGIGATIFNYTGSGYPFQFGNGGAQDSWNQRLRDCTIACSSGLGGVKFKSTRFCGLDRVRIEGPTGGSKILVYFDPGDGTIPNYYAVLDCCEFAGATAASDIAVKLHSTSANGANANTIKNCHFNLAFLQAVLIDGGDTNRIERNEFNGCATGVKLQTGNTVLNRILNNQFDGVTTFAIDIGTSVTNTIVRDNTGSTLYNNNGTETWGQFDNPGAVWTGTGKFSDYPNTVPSAATIAVPDGARGLAISGTADITSLTGGKMGQVVTLIFTGTAGSLGVVDGGTLALAGNFVYTPNDTLTLISSGGPAWFEVCRSVN